MSDFRVENPSGGSLVINTTPIIGGTDTRVLFNDAGVVGEDAGFTYNKTTDSVTVAGDLTVADEAYGAGWNGSSEVPTKNAIYDKIITMPDGSGAASQIAYWSDSDTLTGNNSLFYEQSNTRFRVNKTTSEAIGALIGSGSSTQKGLVVRGTTDSGVSTSPDLISGLLAWWKADALTLNNNDAVSSWLDSSGNGYSMVQATGANQPIYKTNIVNGKPVVRFDATNDELAVSLSTTTSAGWTVFIVYSGNTNGNPRRAIQGNGNWLLGPYQNSNQMYNGAFINSGTVSAGTFLLASGRQTSVGGQFFKNSTLIGTNGQASSNSTVWNLSTAGEPLDGDIAEAIIFSRPLSGYEMDSVEKYLGAKYAITLTSSHTQLSNLLEVQNAAGTVLGSFTSGGNLGIATAQESAYPIQVRATDTGTTFSSPVVSGVHVTGATGNGGGSPAAVEAFFSMARTGAGGLSYSNTGFIGLRRAFVSGVDPNTSMDFHAAGSGFSSERVLSLFSKSTTSQSAYLAGYLGIRSTTDYSPLAGVDINLAAVGDKGLIIKHFASATANAIETQNSSAANLFVVTKDGGLIVNEQGIDVDSRIEGDTDANLIYTDAGNDRVGIGTATPATKLDINGTATATAFAGPLDGTVGATTPAAGTFTSLQADTITNDTGLAAGTYTPTRSAEANLDANVTMTEAQYLRVGNTVTVSGRFTADPTLTATATSFEITLPVASNFGAAEDAAGVAFCGSIAGQGAEIIGVAANDTAKIQWVATDVTSQTWSYTFTYQVI